MPSLVEVGAQLGASDKLIALIIDAVNHGIDMVQDGKKLIPFMMTQSAVTVLATDTMEEAFAVVHDIMRSGEVEFCVLGYDTYLTVEGEKTDAIVVEGYERGREKGLRFAQRYRPAIKAGLLRKGAPVERLGNLKFLAGDVEYRAARETNGI